jgi:glycosyltransferase involved in cell wall biosynthesis
MENSLKRRYANRVKELLRPYYLRQLYFPLFPAAKPKFFQTCWQYPTKRLDSEWTDLTGRQDSRAPSFLFLPMSDWHARMQRTQHLAISLANLGHRCYYLNPHLGRQFPSLYLRDRGHRVSLIGDGLLELHLRLPREPVHHHRLLRHSENRVLTEAFAKIFHSIPKGGVVQIVSLPTWLEVAKELKTAHQFPIICDCHDLLEGFRDMDSAIVSAEKELFEVCDLAIFSSEYLQQLHLERLPALRNKHILLRNAADPFHFLPAAARNQSRPLSDPRLVGYMGSLDDWFDIDCLERAAIARPGWRFRLLGRVEFPEIGRLRRLPNVEFYGEVPYAKLPGLLAEFDVAVIPFRKNKLTFCVDPIKLYEYFSCGLPVVSSRLPEVERFEDLVYLADTPAEFVSQIDKAASETDVALRWRRRDVALSESWTSRAEQLRTLVAGMHKVAAPGTA